MDRFKPGELAWLIDWGKAPYRRPVIILRRTLCKDWPRWMQRNKNADGITYARLNSDSTWMILDSGMQRIEYDFHLFKRQYCPRKKASGG